MNGPLRQGMLPSSNIGQQQNMLSIGNPSSFIQNPGSLASQQAPSSNTMGIPQNIPPNPPMSMLSGGPVPSGASRYPLQSNSIPQQPHQQQQRPMISRQGQNPAANNPSNVHMQSQLQGLPFTQSMMQQSLAGNNTIRRAQSQSHINVNTLGSMAPSVAHSMSMGINPQTGKSTQIRQLSGQQQNPQLHQIRMQQQQPQQSNMSDIMIRNQIATNSAMQPNMGVRISPTQAQVMSSLTQPSPLGSTPLPGNMPPPHQNAFSNGIMHHPQLSTSPRPPSQGMPVSTPVQSHISANRLRTSPDSSNISFMGYPGSQFSGNAAGRVVPNPSSSSYPFSASSPPPIQLSNIPQTSPQNQSSTQGGASTNKTGFFPTPAQQQLDMSSMDMFSPNFSAGMPPPPTIPSQSLSNGPNSHPLPSTTQAPPILNPPQRAPQRSPGPQQSQQLQGGHQLPSDQNNGSTPGTSSQSQRPGSQGSLASTPVSQPPRGSQPPIPSSPFAVGLTVTGRVQPPPPQGLAQPQQSQGLISIAPRPTVGPSPPSVTGGTQRLPPAASPEGDASAISPPSNSDQVGATGRPPIAVGP